MRQPHYSLVIWIQLKHCQDPADSTWNKSIRQGSALGTRSYQASQDASQKKAEMRWVCASHIPRSSFGSSPDPARFHLEQGYASGGCAGDETPLAFPNRPSKKLDMRQVCASPIARSSSGSNWNTTSILLESIWSKGMRQGCALGKPRH